MRQIDLRFDQLLVAHLAALLHSHERTALGAAFGFPDFGEFGAGTIDHVGFLKMDRETASTRK
jgi:hypothetical protein